jgi:hypothetical protein
MHHHYHHHHPHHLFFFRRSVQDYKIQMDMEIVTFEGKRGEVAHGQAQKIPPPCAPTKVIPNTYYVKQSPL